MYCGLNNLGNTCYMNSLLQTLFMTRQFREALFKWKFDKDKHPAQIDCIPYQLQYLFAKMQENGTKATDARDLVRSFQWDPQESFAQHDVQEFCRVLFDAISQSDESDFINKLYQSHCQSYVQCQQCNYESLQNDSFLDLSLTVKSDFLNVYNESLEKALQYYVKPEKLEGDNKYSCSNCKEKVEAIKGLRLKNLAEIFTIQLNRFELDMNTFERKKVNDYVSFPFVIDMNNFLKPYDQIIVENNQDILLEREQLKLQYEQEKLKSCFIDPLKRKQRAPSPESQQTKKIRFMEDHSLQALNVEKTNQDLKLSQQQIDQKWKSLDQEKVITKSSFTTQTLNPNQIQADEAYDINDPLFGDIDDLGDLGEDTNVNTIKSKDIYGSKKQDQSDQQDYKNNENDVITVENQTHNQIVQLQIDEYLLNGPNVYELYSVMIHSGGALGGHYYAYIKSFENNNWYCFNDSTVELISWKQIQSMFGDKYPKYNMGTSAYFLMYRRANQLNQQKPEIPQNLIEQIQIERQQQIEREIRMEQERKEKQMELKIKCFYKSQEKVIKTRKDVLLKDFNEQIRQEFNVQELPENTRIRFYNNIDGIPQDTFTNKDQEMLQVLHFNDYKSVLLETKTSYEQFSEYDAHIMLIKLCIWRDDIESLDEQSLKPLRIFIRDDKTVDELKDIIQQKLGVCKENQILLQKNILHGGPYTMRIDENINCTLYDLKIGRNVTFYFEEKNNEERFKWDIRFENEKHKCTIIFNDPRKQVNSFETPEYCFDIIIDNRFTMYQLKEKIGDYLGIDIDSFIMKKSNRYAAEIKDLSTQIKDNQIQGRASLCLMMGKPSLKGIYKIKVGMGGISPKYSDTIDFEYGEFFEMEVNAEWYIKELKQKMCILIKEKKNIDLNPNLIRLRYKMNTKLNQTFHDNSLIKNCRVYDNQTFIIEQLDEPDQIKQNQMLGYVRFYDPETFTLSFPPKEIYLYSTDTLHILSNQLITLFDIEQDAIEAIKINNLYSFTITDLVTASFDWQLLKFNQNEIGKQPWFVMTDSYYIIIRDTRKVPKDMTQLRQKVDEILAKSSDPAKIQQRIPAQQQLSNKPKEKALKITVVKKQEEKQNE